MQVSENMNTVKRFMGNTAIAEVYSPPRVTAEGKAMGVKCGFAFDVTVPDKDGYVWDFTKRSCRRRAWMRLKEECAYMLVGSPPCTAFFYHPEPQRSHARGEGEGEDLAAGEAVLPRMNGGGSPGGALIT